MTTTPRRWLNALLHRGPGYDTPTTTERYAQARIGYALAHCDRIEDQLHGRDTATVTEVLTAIRCIRTTLDPDGAL